MNDLKLKKKIETAVDSNGQSFTYTKYYVVVMGVEIVLKPIDKTSKQLLNCALNQDEKR